MIKKTAFFCMKIAVLGAGMALLTSCASSGGANSQVANELGNQINSMSGAPARHQKQADASQQKLASACNKWCHNGWCSTHCTGSKGANKL